MPLTYEKQKAASLKKVREASAQGRDIGSIPDVIDAARRASCERDFGLFCLTYFPHVFSLEWSDDHRKVIAQIEDAVLRGGLFATAMPRGSGKALALDTPLPTPSGWTTMGEVRPGDTLYDESGAPCRVTYATPVMEGRPCYRVSFDDGEEVVCDADHLWTVADRFARNNPLTLRTEDMAGRVVLSTKRGWTEYRYTIPVCEPIEGRSPESWAISPYMLGVWLGDGTTTAGQVTIGDHDLTEMRGLIERHETFNGNGRRKPEAGAATYSVGMGRRLCSAARVEQERRIVEMTAVGIRCREIADATGAPRRTVQNVRQRTKGQESADLSVSLATRLGWLGLLGNKHIPDSYLRASVGDRMELLRGLMDTDGSIAKNGSSAEYVTKLPRLRDDVMELLAGLGYKRRSRPKQINGRTYYRITFTPSDGRPVFSLPRKVARQKNRSLRISATRRIVGIEPVSSVPVRCVQVDSPNRLYLCGRGMVPTHNTSLAEVACIFAESYGHRDFVVLIGSDEGSSLRMLDSIKTEFESNDLLLDDFPEVCHPIRALEGISHRCKGQTCGGERTHIGWAADEVVMPTIEGSRASGAIIKVAGITGGVRGMKFKKASGETVRPSLVVIDDPQTDQALDVDTPIPTPRGFVPMGELAVGDEVYDEDGRICRIVATSPVMHGHPCYQVAFDDGETIIADAGHKWQTSTALQRTNRRRKRPSPNPSFASRPQCQPRPFADVVTTERIAGTLSVTADGRFNHSIPTAGALFGRDADLPVPPYTLGAWLGDGSKSCGRITTADPEMLDFIAGEGFEIGKEVPSFGPGGVKGKASTYQIKKLSKCLRKASLVGLKKIPGPYLFASYPTRLSLLQGLMDTDGSISLGTKGIKGTRCVFINTNPDLIEGVVHLCRSLGLKPTVHLKRIQGKSALPCWHVTFITSLPVFRLSRKLARIPTETRPDTRQRYVVAADSVESRPVRCIEVDSPSHLYLCGRGLIPTHNSARSASQCETRERILAGAILGLAGPGKKIAGIMPCTVIRRDDMADRILDRQKHPEWNGTRTKLVYAFPTDEKLWERYGEVRADSFRAGNGGREATEFYAANREAMDAGAVVAWPARHDEDELSAVQNAMNLKLRDERAFFAEYQNEPIPEAESRTDDLTPDQVSSKINRTPRGLVPLAASRVTGFIDVQGSLLYWLVAAWEDDFTGYVLDYGTFPEQPVGYFQLRDATKTYATAFPSAGLEGQIFGALEALTESLIGREWERDDGAAMSLERLLIDANWGVSTDTIYQFCRQSRHSAIVMPSHGKYIGASSVPMREYQRKPGDRAGLNWRIPAVKGKRTTRHALYDTNFWKSFVHARFHVAMGDRGCLSLFGEKPYEHRLLAEHICAEFRVRTSGRGREVDEWKLRPERPDNHWFDGLVGSAVAASIQGAELPEAKADHPTKTKAERVSFAELQRFKHSKRG